MWQLGGDAAKENVVKQIPNVAAGIFLLVGVLLLAGIVSDKLRQKKCTCVVQGKCVEVKWKYSNTGNSVGGGRVYCPVYEYYYNGQTYTGSRGIYTNMIYVAEGEEREIFINPDKPEMFYEKGMSRTTNAMALFLGTLFVAVSAIVIYAYNFL